MQTAEPTGRILIRRADASDAEELARFASRTFSEAFGAENTPEDLALYLARAYGPAQQGAELRDPTWTTLLAEEGKSLAGYAQVRTGPTPSCVTGQGPIELYRFYVDSPWQGRGGATVDGGGGRRGNPQRSQNSLARRVGTQCPWSGVLSEMWVRGCGRAFVPGGDRSPERSGHVTLAVTAALAAGRQVAFVSSQSFSLTVPRARLESPPIRSRDFPPAWSRRCPGQPAPARWPDCRA